MTVKDKSCFICLQATMHTMQATTAEGLACLFLAAALWVRVQWRVWGWAECSVQRWGEWEEGDHSVRLCAHACACEHELTCLLSRTWATAGSRHAAGLREDEKQRAFSCRLCSIVAETHAKLLGWEQDPGERLVHRKKQLVYKHFWFHSEFL